MEKLKKRKTPNIKLRYNLLAILVYVIGAILIFQLFNLQIVNGATYRETSNTRLTRDSVVYAARGDILDRNGIALASSEMTFALELYKTKLENSALNSGILEVIKTLEANGDTYIDTFPIMVNPFEYNFANEERKSAWLKNYNLEPDTSAEKAFYYFKDKYEIDKEEIEDIRKILAVRYRISSEGYSSTKSLRISNSVSRESALIFGEQSDKFPAIDVVTDAKRSYPNRKHCITYTSDI